MMNAASTTWDITASWTPLWEPPPKMSPSEWAEANLVLPPSAAVPGPVKLVSYQRQLLDQIAAPDVRIGVLMLASQTGKSLTVDCIMAHAICTAPAPMLHISPTQAKAVDFVRDRISPLIKASPALRALVGGGAHGSGDSMAHKSFPGGSCSFGSSHRPDDLAARSIKYLFLDEVDRFAESAGREGDPVGLAIKRTHVYPATKKIIIASTPTTSSSRISQFFERGDCRKFFVACPECGAVAVLSLERLVYQSGRPATARIKCEDCGHHLTDRERSTAIDAGSWMTTADRAEPGIASWWADVTVSKFATLEAIAVDQMDAERTPEKRRVFRNTSGALPYTGDDGEPLDALELQARAEPIRAPYAADFLFITCGVDVQADRLEASFLAHHADGRATVLNHVRLDGDTSTLAPFRLLDQALGETFKLQDGRTLGVELTGVDSGYSTTNVAEFCRAQQQERRRRVIAVKGVSGWDKPTIRKSANELKSRTALYLCGVDTIKAGVTARLRLTDPKQEGYIHFSDILPPSYFKSLCSEKLVTKIFRGFAKQHWEMVNKNGKGNEAFDAIVYAFSVATQVKIPTKTPTPADKPAQSYAERMAAISARGTR